MLPPMGGTEVRPADGKCWSLVRLNHNATPVTGITSALQFARATFVWTLSDTWAPGTEYDQSTFACSGDDTFPLRIDHYTAPGVVTCLQPTHQPSSDS